MNETVNFDGGEFLKSGVYFFVLYDNDGHLLENKKLVFSK